MIKKDHAAGKGKRGRRRQVGGRGKESEMGNMETMDRKIGENMEEIIRRQLNSYPWLIRMQINKCKY